MRLPKVWIGSPRGPMAEGYAMTQMDTDETGAIKMARHHARLSGHVQNAQMMLMAAGIAAFSIVAVATAMLTTVL